MIINLLNKLMHKYMWVFEIVEGDKGFVLAKNREEAIKKLSECYPDVMEIINNGDTFVYDADHTEIHGDVFVNVPW